jgi:photosystem II stability/assembly factor-like uncharacterized protein
MHWRAIGPFRGGRTKAVTGVPDSPHLFYVGVVNGGVWRTDDAGRTWDPIFDDQPTGSIGDIAVAPSDARVIYVGSGEGLHRPDLSVGDGVYKSVDGGETWVHLGLRDGQQISRIAVDPRYSDRLFVAVLGHPYGPNEERGVFRSTDGGRTFQKVLYIDDNTGASDVDIDPENPDIVYACLWEDREGPWENANWSGKNGGIFKSTDGGANWRKLTAGFPEGDQAPEQADVAIAPSDPRRLCATVALGRGVGIFRSDDAGEHWMRITEDPRPAGRIGGGDLPAPAVDPKDPNIVYSASVVMWRSTDGGRTWTAIRGAPGGDDYQRVPRRAQSLARLVVDHVVTGVRVFESLPDDPSVWLLRCQPEYYHRGPEVSPVEHKLLIPQLWTRCADVLVGPSRPHVSTVAIIQVLRQLGGCELVVPVHVRQTFPDSIGEEWRQEPARLELDRDGGHYILLG